MDGVNGGSIAVLSKLRKGEDENSAGSGWSRKDLFLVGLISCDEDRIRAISSSARPRRVCGRSPSISDRLMLFFRCRGAEESRDEK